jgi:hypothetical protein
MQIWSTGRKRANLVETVTQKHPWANLVETVTQKHPWANLVETVTQKHSFTKFLANTR